MPPLVGFQCFLSFMVSGVLLKEQSIRDHPFNAYYHVLVNGGGKLRRWQFLVNFGTIVFILTKMPKNMLTQFMERP